MIEHAAINLPLNLDFNSLPDAIPGNNVIFLKCVNVEDGVGDWKHFLSFAKDLQKLRAKGYILVGALVTKTMLKKPEDHPENKRAAFIQSQDHITKLLFDRYYHIQRRTNGYGYKYTILCSPLGTDNRRKNFSDIQSYIDKSCSSLSISFSYGFPKEFNEDATPPILLHEYGMTAHSSEDGKSILGLTHLTEKNILFPKAGIKLYPEKNLALIQLLIDAGANTEIKNHKGLVFKSQYNKFMAFNDFNKEKKNRSWI